MKAMMLSALLLCKAALGQADFHNAVDYNAFIANAQREVVRKNLEYISFSVHSNEYKLIEAKRKAVLKQIREAKASISGMPVFEGSGRLRDEALDVLSEYQRAFDNDFKMALQLKKKSQSSFEAMEAYFEAQNDTEERVNKATQRFNKVQERFVDQHNLTFAEGKDNLTKSMEQVTALNLYLRNIYLEYFRVSKAFAEMLNLLYEQKCVPLEKQRREVIDLVNKAIPVLEGFGPFNNDRNYLDQTIDLLEYYRDLSSNEFAKIVVLFKQKSGIDQQDANYINKVLLDYNIDAERRMININTASNNLLQDNIASIQ